MSFVFPLEEDFIFIFLVELGGGVDIYEKLDEMMVTQGEKKRGETKDTFGMEYVDKYSYIKYFL